MCSAGIKLGNLLSNNKLGGTLLKSHLDLSMSLGIKLVDSFAGHLTESN